MPSLKVNGIFLRRDLSFEPFTRFNHSREVTTSLSEDIVASHAEALTGRIGSLGLPYSIPSRKYWLKARLNIR